MKQYGKKEDWEIEAENRYLESKTRGRFLLELQQKVDELYPNNKNKRLENMQTI